MATAVNASSHRPPTVPLRFHPSDSLGPAHVTPSAGLRAWELRFHHSLISRLPGPPSSQKSPVAGAHQSDAAKGQQRRGSLRAGRLLGPRARPSLPGSARARGRAYRRGAGLQDPRPKREAVNPGGKLYRTTLHLLSAHFQPHRQHTASENFTVTLICMCSRSQLLLQALAVCGSPNQPLKDHRWLGSQAEH